MKNLKQFAVIKKDLLGDRVELLEVSNFDLYDSDLDEAISKTQDLIKEYKSKDMTVEVLWRDFLNASSDGGWCISSSNDNSITTWARGEYSVGSVTVKEN